MSPWSFADLLRDDIDAWVSRMKQEAREKGQTLLGQTFRARLAGKLGVTPRQLDRYCAGETMPDADKLRIICQEVGTNRAVKHLARECGVGVYDRVDPEDATLADQVRQAARILREVGQATQAAMAADRNGDGHVSVNEFRAVDREISQALDALAGMRGMLQAKAEAGLKR